MRQPLRLRGRGSGGNLTQDQDGLESVSKEQFEFEASQAVERGNKLEQFRFRPDVEVNAVVDAEEMTNFVFDFRVGGPLVDQPAPFLEVLALRPLGTFRVVTHQVLDGRARPIDIERKPLVGYGHIQDAGGFQHPKEVLKRRERILAVLDEVIGDDEILGRVADCRENARRCR